MTELTVPNHIGFILDGNRRWAKEHGLPVYEGHLAGYVAIKEVMLAALEAGVKFASVYTFSTENWNRSKDEIDKIMSLVLRLFTTDLPLFDKYNIRVMVLGTRNRLNKKIIAAIEEVEKCTAKNTGATLAVCFNYGGQLEIVDAVKKIIKSGVKADNINEELISKNLYAPEIPPVDIVVRTSGEQRLSNFMMWRTAYSELMFIDKMWPDMKKSDIKAIIKEYSKRNRRHGA